MDENCAGPLVGKLILTPGCDYNSHCNGHSQSFCDFSFLQEPLYLNQYIHLPPSQPPKIPPLSPSISNSLVVYRSPRQSSSLPRSTNLWFFSHSFTSTTAPCGFKYLKQSIGYRTDACVQLPSGVYSYFLYHGVNTVFRFDCSDSTCGNFIILTLYYCSQFNNIFLICYR